MLSEGGEIGEVTCSCYEACEIPTLAVCCDLVSNLCDSSDQDKRDIFDERDVERCKPRERIQGSLPIVGDL